MEVITKEELRDARERQAERMTRYHFKLWMMERKKRHNGSKRIH